MKILTHNAHRQYSNVKNNVSVTSAAEARTLHTRSFPAPEKIRLGMMLPLLSRAKS